MPATDQSAAFRDTDWALARVTRRDASIADAELRSAIDILFAEEGFDPEALALMSDRDLVALLSEVREQAAFAQEPR